MEAFSVSSSLTSSLTAISEDSLLISCRGAGTSSVRGVALFSGVELFGRAYQLGVYEDYMPSQPVAYSHKLHAGKMGIECKYCHHSAEKSKHAGIPSVNVCMNCHKNIWENIVLKDIRNLIICELRKIKT